jgi:hypothetical protein
MPASEKLNGYGCNWHVAALHRIKMYSGKNTLLIDVIILEIACQITHHSFLG